MSCGLGLFDEEEEKEWEDCEEKEDLTFFDFSFTLPICFWDEYSCVDDGIPSSNLSANH